MLYLDFGLLQFMNQDGVGNLCASGTRYWNRFLDLTSLWRPAVQSTIKKIEEKKYFLHPPCHTSLERSWPGDYRNVFRLTIGATQRE